jgi:hypothetical protein
MVIRDNGAASFQPAFLNEHMHHVRHAEQRRERHVDNAARRVGSRQPFHVDVHRRLLIEPNQIECFALPLLAALVVALEADGGIIPDWTCSTSTLSSASATPMRIDWSLIMSPGIIPVPHCELSFGSPTKKPLHAVARDFAGL